MKPHIFAALQLKDGRTYRHDFDLDDFVSVPRAGELFRLEDIGGAVATIERIVWRPNGSVEMYLRPFGQFRLDEARLHELDWSEGEWWTDEAPG